MPKGVPILIDTPHGKRSLRRLARESGISIVTVYLRYQRGERDYARLTRTPAPPKNTNFTPRMREAVR